ncbi:MAG: PAS domain-containing protein, partial [Halanaerobium sp.]
QLLGEILMLIYRMIFKEEHVIFPVAMETLSLKEWKQIQQQSLQMGYVYIEPPQKTILAKKENDTASKAKGSGHPGSQSKEGGNYTHPGALPEMEADTVEGAIPLEGVMLGLGTGHLSLEEVKMMLNKLPLDITYVDQNDRVKFFSNPEERFFPRSKAIIGRTVQNCHPPESVHIVEKILSAFKEGEKDKARFWIQMKGKFILIEYYALRDEDANYRGTIEVSQDLTELRKLEGEQRLLDWE